MNSTLFGDHFDTIKFLSKFGFSTKIFFVKNFRKNVKMAIIPLNSTHFGDHFDTLIFCSIFRFPNKKFFSN